MKKRVDESYNFKPTMFTFTVSTIMPVKCSTLYFTDSFKASATASIDTPYLIKTYTSIKIRFRT